MQSQKQKWLFRLNWMCFPLFILLIMVLVTAVVPNHVQTSTQAVTFVSGLIIALVGFVWRVVQIFKKVSEKESVVTITIGTTIAVLTVLSWLVW